MEKLLCNIIYYVVSEVFSFKQRILMLVDLGGEGNFNLNFCG